MKLKSMFAALLSVLLLLCAFACSESGPEPEERPEDTGITSFTFAETDHADYINWYGRSYLNTGKAYQSVICNNSGSGFEVKFYGTELKMTYLSEIITQDFLKSGDGRICVSVDGDADYYANARDLAIRSSATEVTLVSGLKRGTHTVEVRKATEGKFNSLEIRELKTDGFFVEPDAAPERRLEFYGDSITCGRGAQREVGDSENDLPSQENAMLTYGMYAARKLGAQANLFCVSGASVGSYETNAGADIIPKLYTRYYPTAGAKLQWDFTKYVPDAVVIDLGTNDIIGNATIAAVENFDEKLRSEYANFISELREVYPDAAIILCSGTFRYSKADIPAYNTLFAELADSFGEEGNVHHLALAPTNSAHPSYTENQTYGDQLAALIAELLGW